MADITRLFANITKRDSLFLSCTVATFFLSPIAVMAQSLPVLKPQAHQKKAAAITQAEPEYIAVTADRPIAGGRMKRQTAPEATSSITSAAIVQKAAAATPLQLIKALPGVNTGETDAFGLSIRNFVVVRGLDETEMGWVLEGMPATDQSVFYPYTETYADNENISDITLIAGTSRINDPVQTATGGEYIESIRDPSDKAGGHLTYSYGSFRAERVFARAETGLIGNSGVKAFLSYSNTADDNFNGSGRSHRDEFNFKIVKDWNGKARTSIYASYSNWFNARQNFYSLAGWETYNKTGNGFAAGNYASQYTPSVTTNYWKDYVYHRRTVLTAVQNEIYISPKTTLHINPYFHYIALDSPGETTINPAKLYEGDVRATIDTAGLYQTNNAGSIAALANSNGVQYAAGVNIYAQHELTPRNFMIFGYWHDHWNENQINGLTPMDRYGDVSNDSGAYLLKDVNGRVVAGTNFHIGSEIDELYASDTQSLLDSKLKISAGLKVFMDHLSGTNQVPGPQYHFASSMVQPLPRVNISYQVTPDIQIYVNGMTNTRSPVPQSSYPNSYSLNTGAISQAGNPSTKPEYTITEEVGARYRGLINVDAVLFNMNITNHQLVTTVVLNGAAVTEAVSAGGERVRGASLELGLRPYHGFAPYVNGQYLNTRLGNNLAVGSDYLPTKGKEMVESPKYMANIGVSYTYHRFYANLDFKWVDSQYSTFMNDQSMPAYKTVDLGFGYHFKSIGAFKNPTLRVNLDNLSDVKYLGIVSGVANNAVTTTGVFGTRIAAGSPTYYLAAPFSAMASISADF